jgi:6-phosphogluconolactonase
LVVEHQPVLAQTAAFWIANAVKMAIVERGRCSLALAGGSTPQHVYERLAEPPLVEQVGWENVEIYFGDERCVPPDHADSNYRMAEEALLRRVPIPREHIHRMKGEAPDTEAAAREYDRLMPARIDVLILGMGVDGHTASLFPNEPAMREHDRRIVPARSPNPPVLRLTITPPVIAGARAVLVIVSGSEKAAMVARALEGPHTLPEVPIQLARHRVWFIDKAAGAGLRRLAK